MPLKQIVNQPDQPDDANKASPMAASPLSSTPSAASAPTTMSSSKNILSSDVEIKGTLKFSQDLIIDGKIEGEVNSQGDLTVGENAKIQGDIKTRSVTVFGKVEGNITVTDRCELKQNAELVGDITAGKLAIEEGATFMGSSTVGAAAAAAAASSGNKPGDDKNKPGGGDQNKHGGGGNPGGGGGNPNKS